MVKARNILLCENPTLTGNILYKIDRTAHNFKFYVRRHMVTIEIFFLLVYTMLNLYLAKLVNSIEISIFITLFLFVLGVERIVMFLKTRMDREALESKEIEIKKEVGLAYEDLDKYTIELKKHNRILQRKNDILKDKTIELNKKLENKR